MSLAGKTAFSPKLPKPSANYCKSCVHFLPNQAMRDAKHGFCKLFGTVDLVTGEVEYTSANLSREYECKGQYFEPKETVTRSPSPQ